MFYTLTFYLPIHYYLLQFPYLKHNRHFVEVILSGSLLREQYCAIPPFWIMTGDYL